MGLIDGARGEMKKGLEKMNGGWRKIGQEKTQSDTGRRKKPAEWYI